MPIYIQCSYRISPSHRISPSNRISPSYRIFPGRYLGNITLTLLIQYFYHYLTLIMLFLVYIKYFIVLDCCENCELYEKASNFSSDKNASLYNYIYNNYIRNNIKLIRKSHTVIYASFTQTQVCLC